jgi:hypothetical protein
MGDMQLASIEQELQSVVITDERHRELEQQRAQLLGGDAGGGAPVVVIDLSEAEYEALTGEPAALLPEGDLPVEGGGSFEDGGMCPMPPSQDFGPLSPVGDRLRTRLPEPPRLPIVARGTSQQRPHDRMSGRLIGGAGRYRRCWTAA